MQKLLLPLLFIFTVETFATNAESEVNRDDALFSDFGYVDVKKHYRGYIYWSKDQILYMDDKVDGTIDVIMDERNRSKKIYGVVFTYLDRDNDGYFEHKLSRTEDDEKSEKIHIKAPSYKIKNHKQLAKNEGRKSQASATRLRKAHRHRAVSHL